MYVQRRKARPPNGTRASTLTDAPGRQASYPFARTSTTRTLATHAFTLVHRPQAATKRHPHQSVAASQNPPSTSTETGSQRPCPTTSTMARLQKNPRGHSDTSSHNGAQRPDAPHDPVKRQRRDGQTRSLSHAEVQTPGSPKQTDAPFAHGSPAPHGAFSGGRHTRTMSVSAPARSPESRSKPRKSNRPQTAFPLQSTELLHGCAQTPPSERKRQWPLAHCDARTHAAPAGAPPPAHPTNATKTSERNRWLAYQCTQRCRRSRMKHESTQPLDVLAPDVPAEAAAPARSRASLRRAALPASFRR